MVMLTSYTYWLSQFAVVGATLLWVYFKHHERFTGVPELADRREPRRASSATSSCRPRRRGCSRSGASSTRSRSTRRSTTTAASSPSRSNPYAAMPSLHSMDALIVGIVMFGLVRSKLAKALWLAWPAWVGVRGHLDREPLLARRRRGLRARARDGLGAPTRPRCCERSAHDARSGRRRAGAVSQLDRVKQEYTQAAREILARSMRGVAKTKLTPDMLTLAGVSLCLAGAVLVGFEERNEKLFFWLGGALFVIGSVADILDGALARAASKGTVFGAFLDSTFDRLGEAAMLAAIGLVFMRDGNEVALVATFAAVIGSFLVSLHAREGRGTRTPRGRRLRLARRARRPHLGRPLPRSVGVAPVADLPARRDGLDHRRAAHALRSPPAPRARRAARHVAPATTAGRAEILHARPITSTIRLIEARVAEP